MSKEQKPAAELVYFKRHGSDKEDVLPVLPGTAVRQIVEPLITRIVPLYTAEQSGQTGKRDILAICDAYESGMGHGLQRDGHKSGAIFANPECGKAYEIGYCEGEQRAEASLKPPKATPTPAQPPSSRSSRS